LSSKNTSDAVVQPPEVDLSGIDALIEPYLGEKIRCCGPAAGG